MEYNESIEYRGYTITKRRSICDDVECYYAIKLNYLHLGVFDTLEICKMNIDNWIKEYSKL